MPEMNLLLRALSITDIDLPSVSHVSLETPPCTPVTPRPPVFGLPQNCPFPPMTPATPRAVQIFPDEAYVFQPEGHPKQGMIDGEIWPPIFKPEFVRSAKGMSPRDSDVFVCTYPKCGTTWIQHICSQLLSGDYEPDVGKELCMTSPMIERMGAKYADNLTSPRLLKTHFAHYNCPKSNKAKYIYAVRNPKDCLTSYFFHNRNFKIYDWADGEFDTFFELFASGQLGFGDYFDHLVSWLPHIHDENVLFLTYEDMVADLELAVYKIGNFLGGQAAEMVNDPEILKKVVKESKLDAMKKNQTRWFPSANLKETFIRKGGSRDWKNHFSKEQSERLDAIFRTRLAGTEAEKWWQQEMSWTETPEIVITTDEDFDDNESLPSVSRRNSISSSYDPSSRRSSLASVCTGFSISTGYGSVWSGGYDMPSSSSR